jgi:Flp pilus assembly pilin Flp
MDLIIKFACEETGAPALEYSLLLALIGIFLISSIGALGTSLIGVFISMSGKLAGA